jgi:hypothetical protein
MEEINHRIAYALHMESKWQYGKDNRITLEEKGLDVTPEDFDNSMKGKIFCPVCSTPLSRSPDQTAITSNSRTAHFKHKPTYSKVPCRLKVNRKKGLSYNNEEEARKAIEDEALVVVSSWMINPPTVDDDTAGNGDFDHPAIEDVDGPETEVVIRRHKGKEFKLPSRVSSVSTVCKEFHKNIHRGYHFPGSKYPALLSDILFDTDRIDRDTNEKERLFFGKIVGYGKLKYRNVIRIQNDKFGIYKIYTWPHLDERKHISSKSDGRYILFHSSLGWEGDTPKSFIDHWGQYSLLPEKYEKYLLNLRS